MIERHIEKIVLAACLLLLVYATVRWVPSSPREVEVIGDARGGKQALSPAEVDRALAEAARGIERDIRQAQPEPYTPPSYLNELVQRQEQPLGGTDPLLDFGVARLPLASEEPPDVEPVRLADLLKAMPEPGRPHVRVEREYARKTPDPGDVLAGHIVATYPWEELSENWQEALSKTGIRGTIIVAGVEMEIRELRPDGSWSDPRPASLDRLPLYDRNNVPVAVPTVPDYDDENAERIFESIQALLEMQDEILQPSWWDIWWSTHEWNDWKVNLPDNPVSTAAAEAMPADAPARAGGAGGYPGMPGMPGMPGGGMPGMPGMPGEPGGAAARRQPVRRTTPQRRTVRTTPRSGGMPGGGMPGMPGGGGMPGMPGGGGMPGMPGGPGGNLYGTPTRRQPVRRQPERRTTPIPVPEAVVERPEPKIVPSLAQQVQDGTVLLWGHDTALEPLKTYQYRVRLVLLNPLITYVEDVEDPADARQALIQTPFSRWSSPVTVPQETEFFVTGHSQAVGGGMVYVDIFTRCQGQWVSERFKVAEGDGIGELKTIKVTNPATGERESLDVDFTTRAVAVKFDFTKTVQRGIVSRATVEMIYLNEEGQLRTRVRAIDEESERYKQLKDEAERARTVTTAGRSRFR